jgi:hypothetical protein
MQNANNTGTKKKVALLNKWHFEEKKTESV